MPPTDCEIQDARSKLAASLKLPPERLIFIGSQEHLPGTPPLYLFNVDCPCHPQHNSTLSVRLAHAD